ncbi:MAG TPA: helix-turn-helix domain-containing protein [Puia sp.]|nr:helix-turn-helix domain-containing protein [Puia sp.]
MFRRQIITIPERLRAFVRHVWALEPARDPSGDPRDPSAPSMGSLFSIYADGCPGIIFQQSENGLLLNQNVRKTSLRGNIARFPETDLRRSSEPSLFLDGDPAVISDPSDNEPLARSKELSSLFLYGQTVAPIDMHSAGRLGMIVISFHPYAMHSLFRLSAKELTDDCLDISLLSAVQGRLLREQLWNMGTSLERVSALFDYLEQMVERNKAVADPGMAHATSSLLQSNGKMPLPALRRTLNLSPRTFERRFEQYIGVSPKLFSRISQFQAALKHLQSGKFDKLSDIAYTYGYSDQSHFIRNFSQFTGLSPLRWQKHAGGEVGEFPGLVRTGAADQTVAG